MTIFALSSGPGVAGVAVIRVSGKYTNEVIKILTGKDLPQPRVATLRKINNINNSGLIDEGIVLWFPGPESYTGEDMAEFHIHGSRAVINAMHNSISKIQNCRLAEPGEFTRRAFQNGKVNLLKAESIADLVAAETEIQRKQAVKIMNGKTSNKFNSWRSKLIKILSYIEAKIDFPDEDLPSDILNKIKIQSKKIISEIESSLKDNRVGEIIREGYKISIIGPPNVGKSSLLNYLSNKDVAIVSSSAGTTRDVIETHLNIDGYPIIISDTAGIREARNEIEKKGIKLSLKKASEADLNIIIIEPKSKQNQHFLNKYMNARSILIVNKVDSSKIKISSKLKKLKPILISIKKHKNIQKVIDLIKQKIKNQFKGNEHILITRMRHRKNLEDCFNHLKNFHKKNDESDFDKAAEDIRLASRSLGKITGKFDVEDILDSIFNDFCIGK